MMFTLGSLVCPAIKSSVITDFSINIKGTNT